MVPATRYRAVMFDLFDTLVLFDRDRLPVVELTGKTVRSTAGHIHEVLVRYHPRVTLDACYAALIESWHEAERLRAIDHREVPAPERFEHFLRCLALDPAACPIGLVSGMIDAHRRELAKAADFPARHAALVRALAERFALGIVSNFDYTPTAMDILERSGVVDRFKAIVVSDEIGWRKPRPEIFAKALRRLGVAPSDALFIGDRAEIDVAGAHAAGLDAVWLNRAGDPLPRDVRPPRWQIRELTELTALLDG